jgi:hypothetical protein
LIFATYGLLTMATSSAWGASLTPGDILVSSTTDLDTSLIREYTTTGQLVQTFTAPVAPGIGTAARGIVTDASGNVQIYNGTFTPTLTTLDPTGAGSFSNHTMAGWSTINNITFGGVAVSGNYAYVSDMTTANGGEPNGIVRFDLTNFSATRFASGPANGSGDYVTVSLGLNGLLYAPWPGGSPVGDHIDVINPTLMTKTTIDLPFLFQVEGVTADQAGNIYAAGARGDNTLYKLDSHGNVLASLSVGTNSLDGYDFLNGLQISNSGQLLTTTSNGEVILTDTNFSHLTTFDVGAQSMTFATFTTALTIASVPEPASLTLLAVGLAAVAFQGRHHRRGNSAAH